MPLNNDQGWIKPRDYFIKDTGWQLAAGEEWGGDISLLLLTLWLVNPIYDCDARYKHFSQSEGLLCPIWPIKICFSVFVLARGSSMQLPAPPMSFLLWRGWAQGALGDLFLILQHTWWWITSVTVSSQHVYEILCLELIIKACWLKGEVAHAHILLFMNPTSFNKDSIM